LAHEKAAASNYHSRWQRAEALHDDTIAKLERVEKQAAAMREALVVSREFLNSRKGLKLPSYTAFRRTEDAIKNALDSTAGANYISKESVRPLVEALKRINEISVIDEDMGCAVNWAGEAIDHARTLGL
jgi:hypothetical protein